MFHCTSLAIDGANFTMVSAGGCNLSPVLTNRAIRTGVFFSHIRFFRSRGTITGFGHDCGAGSRVCS